ncbi:membrane protein [Tsukamurella sp. PLM1]|nr:membrane protein [Tsukamurella sp. PLM1]
MAWTVLGLTVLALIIGYQIKAQCTGAPFDEFGRSEGFASTPGRICYSDLQFLWSGREVNNHVFPYLTGWIDGEGKLQGGAIEYPVLSGLLFWVGAIGAHNDADFLAHMALLLVPFGLLTAWVLAKVSGRAAALWALAPPLALYAFHNMELPVVAAATVAFGIMAWADRTGGSIRIPAIAAAAVLAVGFDLKIYPGLFVAPLVLYVLTYGRDGTVGLPDGPGRRARIDWRALDWPGAAATAATAVVVAVAINVPFMVFGFEGWRASLKFQELRTADLSTNSIWYWGVLKAFDDPKQYDDFVGALSPLLIVVSIAAVLVAGLVSYRRTGVYPWLGVSGAMLAAFMLFHKVHSPQYVLWLLPFFILLKVDWRLIAAYLLFDLSLELTVWNYFSEHAANTPITWWVQWGVWIGVWGRAALLVVFVWYLPRCALRLRTHGASGAPSSTPPAGSSSGDEYGPGNVDRTRSSSGR